MCLFVKFDVHRSNRNGCVKPYINSLIYWEKLNLLSSFTILKYFSNPKFQFTIPNLKKWWSRWWRRKEIIKYYVLQANTILFKLLICSFTKKDVATDVFFMLEFFRTDLDQNNSESKELYVSDKIMNPVVRMIHVGRQTCVHATAISYVYYWVVSTKKKCFSSATPKSYRLSD